MKYFCFFSYQAPSPEQWVWALQHLGYTTAMVRTIPVTKRTWFHVIDRATRNVITELALDEGGKMTFLTTDAPIDTVKALWCMTGFTSYTTVDFDTEVVQKL